MLKVDGLTAVYGRKTVLADIRFALSPGDWLMVVGPNGAGKSTLLRAIAQTIPHAGRVRLLGREVEAMSPRDRARHLGVLAQHSGAYAAFTVAQVAAMGRYAHGQGRLFPKDPQAGQRIQQALCFAGMEALADRSILTLSGGELQRAFLAQVMAQDPNLLLLDEPGNHLDIPYQSQLFDGIARWLRAAPNRAAISVVHDLSLARAFGSHALLLAAGRQAAFGPVAQALSWGTPGPGLQSIGPSIARAMGKRKRRKRNKAAEGSAALCGWQKGPGRVNPGPWRRSPPGSWP